MGRKSLPREALECFGIKDMQVKFRLGSKAPLLRNCKTACLTFPPTMLQCFWKKTSSIPVRTWGFQRVYLENSLINLFWSKIPLKFDQLPRFIRELILAHNPAH
jgi:hypothetical protein